MAIFTKYGNKIIPNAHWEWPLGIEFLQWVFQPHSGRKVISEQAGWCRFRRDGAGRESENGRADFDRLEQIPTVGSGQGGADPGSVEQAGWSRFR